MFARAASVAGFGAIDFGMPAALSSDVRREVGDTPLTTASTNIIQIDVPGFVR